MMRVTKFYTAEEVEKLTAGGRSYIRTKDNIVVGLAITKQKNPEASNIVVVGDGPGIIKNAQLFVDQNEYVPTYLKLGSNQWLYKGEYKVKRYSDEDVDIRNHHKHRPRNKVKGILFLEKKE
jgi:hypothetical protein